MYINPTRSYIPRTCKGIAPFVQGENLFKVDVTEQDLMSVQNWL